MDSVQCLVEQSAVLKNTRFGGFFDPEKIPEEPKALRAKSKHDPLSIKLAAACFKAEFGQHPMKLGRSSAKVIRPTSGGAAGFTLVEMAVVITLIAIVMTLGLRLLQATQESAAWSETRLKQERIKVALISHLRINGVLPCPDATPVGTAPTGLKGASPCLGLLGRGVLPWKNLGLSVSDAQDGWSNFFTYRVANHTPLTSRNWTSKLAADSAFTINELTTPLVTFNLQERNAAGVLGPTALTPNPVVIVLSHGKNGSGARTMRGTLNAAPVGADEIINASASSTAFISRAPNEVAASSGGIFDDIVSYMTPQDLLQPLINEGSLKACAAYCSATTSTSSLTSTASCTTSGVGICTCPSPSVAGSAGTPAQGTCSGNISKVSCTPCAAIVSTTSTVPPCTTIVTLPVGASPVTCQ